MAKKKNNSVQAKRNRANRARGSKFEKVVADYLDMFVVPHSGSNMRFGLGDIRDVAGTTGGCWLGEAKSQTVGSELKPRYKIQYEWLASMAKEADVYDLTSFLVFTRKGKPFKFVILRYNDYMTIANHQIWSMRALETTKKNVKNTFIDESELATAFGVKTFYTTKRPDYMVTFYNDYLDEEYIILTLEQFKHFIELNKYHWQWMKPAEQKSNAEIIKMHEDDEITYDTMMAMLKGDIK